MINLPLCFRTIFNSELLQSTNVRISFSLSFVMLEMFYIMQNSEWHKTSRFKVCVIKIYCIYMGHSTNNLQFHNIHFQIKE